MRQHRALQLGAVLLAVALLPALFAGGVAADGPGDDSSTAQPLIIDGIIDSLLSDDDDEAEADGGLLDSVFGASFDGYPDGFSADGIEDFEQALGEDSVHYQADSLSIDVAATTPEGEFEATLSVSAVDEEVLIEGQSPDGERSQYFDGETSYINEADEYSQSSDTFDREELYMITELERDLSGVNLTQEAIDGDTVVYTAEDRDIELAVRDTGELDYVEIDDEESVFVDFYGYDATTVAEPAWVAEAEDVTEPADDREPPADEREPPVEEPVDAASIQEEIDSHVPDDAEPGSRFVFVTSDDIQVRVVIGEDGEPEVVGQRDRSERDRAVGIDSPDRDRDIADDERLRERADEIEERIERIDDRIEHVEEHQRDIDREDRIADLEDRIDRHQERIDDNEAEIDRLEERLDDYDSDEREAELREEIREAEEFKETLEDRQASLRDELEDTDDEVERRELNEEIDELDDRIENSEEQIADLESRLDSVDDRAASLEDRIDDREDRIAESEDQIDRLRERIDRLEDGDGSTDHQEHIEELEEERAELEEELDRIEERLAN